MAEASGHSGSNSNVNAQRDTRRVIQVLAPAVPLPVIDYAVSNFFSPRSKSMDVDTPPKGRFMLKKMDSGPMSQYSLTSPTSSRKGDKFKELNNNLNFAMEGDVQTHVQGGTAMACLSLRG